MRLELKMVEAMPAAPAIGDILGGRYEILAELGHGAEGVVMKAHDTRAGATIALKLLPERELSPVRLSRLRRELALARRITHPSVVRIYDLVDLGAWVGLGMELVDGPSLREALGADGTVRDEAWLRALAGGLAEGLASAHAAGVVHRDLKPSNIMLAGSRGSTPRGSTTRPIPKIADFGIARIAEDAPPSARDAVVGDAAGTAGAGTPLYMAPEQLAGDAPVGPSADVYSFGLVVVEAATGRVAREPLSKLRPDLSPPFTAVVDRCLAGDPAERFRDGAALIEALDGAQAAEATRSGRSRRRIVAAVGLAGAAVGVTIFVAWPRTPEPEPQDTFVFRKADLTVAQKTHMQETTRRTLTFTRPEGRYTHSRDFVDRTVTILAADRMTLLKVRVHYDVATHAEEQAGTWTQERLPVDGHTYIAEWAHDRIVVTDDNYQPVSEEEAATVTRSARALGQPAPERAALPDLPVRVGDRVDSLAELLRGSLSKNGTMELTDVDIELAAIDRSPDREVAVFDLRLGSFATESTLDVRMSVGGRLGVTDTGRFYDVDLFGVLRVTGPEVDALGTLTLEVRHRPGG